ncbi:MAG: hypothetical protein H7333_09905 [Bdellovibrionales bacterium]|nr:hypothetical protein [Oligoflexia bacterium]
MMLPMVGMTGMSAGFDLTAIRSAQVFLMGEQTNMGQGAVVAGFDENGKELGAFLGGMIVSACQK